MLFLLECGSVLPVKYKRKYEYINWVRRESK